MPASQPDTESIFVEMPTELKRSLEALVLEYKRRRRPGLRSLSAVVRHACDQLLRQDLPGYVSPLEESAEQDRNT